MTIGINTSPLAGTEGKLLTARMVKDRLDKELVGNVSLRVLPTDRPDACASRMEAMATAAAGGGNASSAVRPRNHSRGWK